MVVEERWCWWKRRRRRWRRRRCRWFAFNESRVCHQKDLAPRLELFSLANCWDQHSHIHTHTPQIREREGGEREIGSKRGDERKAKLPTKSSDIGRLGSDMISILSCVFLGSSKWRSSKPYSVTGRDLQNIFFSTAAESTAEMMVACHPSQSQSVFGCLCVVGV